MSIWSYQHPTKIVFGSGCFENLRDYVEEFKPRKILLVTGRTAMRKLGVTDRAREYLRGCEIITFDRVEQNPCIQTVDECSDLIRRERCDLVIGLGGGSALDVAKVASVLIDNPGSFRDYADGRRTVTEDGVPCIAIPTTAGTGSEVTPFAPITNLEERKKQSIFPFQMYPDIALVDPKLSMTMPPEVTATTGIDAFCHAVEVCFSRRTQPISDALAFQAIKLIFENLRGAFEDGSNLKYRENMSLGSMLAGKALSHTGGVIPHAFSFPLGIRYNIPHGIACALTEVSFLKFNLTAAPEKLSFVARIVGFDRPEDFIRGVEELMDAIKIPRRLRDVGVKEEDLRSLVKDSPTRMTLAGFREPSEEELEEILRESF
ncbi:MAG: iron-containing alcohol dehydrogenase [bacterium]